MDLVPKEDVLQISLTLWNFLGEHPHRTPWKIMIFRLCNIIFMLTVIVFIFANVKQVHGAMYIKTVESAITIIHVSSKDYSVKKSINLLTYLFSFYTDTDKISLIFLLQGRYRRIDR